MRSRTPDATGVSPYDRFVALHGAVMRIRVNFSDGTFQLTNMAHWNIGFCAWHRQYLLDFERALQAVDPGVDLPYWDWAADDGNLFAATFAGELGPPNQAAPVQTGNYAGSAINPLLQEAWGTPLARGGGNSLSWPASSAAVEWLEGLDARPSGAHPMWIFWQILEAGWPNVLTATHNAGHNFVGGHMMGVFSPNDPLFWLHHANVDRIWANWQRNLLRRTGGAHPDDWPLPTETSPLSGDPAPYGHRIDDLMWPWVGDFAPAFHSTSGTPDQLALIQDPAKRCQRFACAMSWTSPHSDMTTSSWQRGYESMVNTDRRPSASRV